MVRTVRGLLGQLDNASDFFCTTITAVNKYNIRVYRISNRLGILGVPRYDVNHLSTKYVDSINVLIHQNK